MFIHIIDIFHCHLSSVVYVQLSLVSQKVDFGQSFSSKRLFALAIKAIRIHVIFFSIKEQVLTQNILKSE